MTIKASKHIVCLCCLITLLSACGSKTIYSEYQPLPLTGWNADSALYYTIGINDTTALYDVLLYVRHTDRYKYQNLWLFINTEYPQIADSIEPFVLTDTIEFFLANDQGKWLGNKYGSTHEMPVIYQHDVQFPHAGNYTYQLSQAMRDELLIGVSNVGLKVVKQE